MTSNWKSSLKCLSVIKTIIWKENCFSSFRGVICKGRKHSKFLKRTRQNSSESRSKAAWVRTEFWSPFHCLLSRNSAHLWFGVCSETPIFTAASWTPFAALLGTWPLDLRPFSAFHCDKHPWPLLGPENTRIVPGCLSTFISECIPPLSLLHKAVPCKPCQIQHCYHASAGASLKSGFFDPC